MAGTGDEVHSLVTRSTVPFFVQRVSVCSLIPRSVLLLWLVIS